MAKIGYVYHNYSLNIEQHTWNAFVDGKHVVLCNTLDCKDLKEATDRAIKIYHDDKTKEEKNKLTELILARTNMVSSVLKIRTTIYKLALARKEYEEEFYKVKKLEKECEGLED
jgi:dynactin complex subunit